MANSNQLVDFDQPVYPDQTFDFDQLVDFDQPADLDQTVDFNQFLVNIDQPVAQPVVVGVLLSVDQSVDPIRGGIRERYAYKLSIVKVSRCQVPTLITVTERTTNRK